MKHVLWALIIAMALVGCHRNTKTTENDVKKAEAALFNENQSLNTEAVDDALTTFSKFAEENPDNPNAPEYLFKALEISINTKQKPEESINMANRLLNSYPEFDKNPVVLFMLASFVYDEQMGDLDKARETYQRIVDNYPDSPFANDAALSIQQLGMSPDELIKMFEQQQQ